MIDLFMDMQTHDDGLQEDSDEGDETGHVYFAIMLSFGVNILLTVIKLLAVIMTGSMAVIASFLDSCLDLVAGSIMYWTTVKMATFNTFKYPQGKARLEPIGTVIFASVMGLASLQILSECIKRLVSGITGTPDDIDMGLVAIIILSITVVVKALLHVYCTWVAEKYNSVSVDAYAEAQTPNRHPLHST